MPTTERIWHYRATIRSRTTHGWSPVNVAINDQAYSPGSDHMWLDVTPVYGKGQNSSTSSKLFPLSETETRTLGRKELALLYWTGCPRNCQAQSPDIQRACRSCVRLRRNISCCSKEMILVASGNRTMRVVPDSKCHRLVQLEEQTSNGSSHYSVRIGTEHETWMRFRFEFRVRERVGAEASSSSTATSSSSSDMLSPTPRVRNNAAWLESADPVVTDVVPRPNRGAATTTPLRSPQRRLVFGEQPCASPLTATTTGRPPPTAPALNKRKPAIELTVHSEAEEPDQLRRRLMVTPQRNCRPSSRTGEVLDRRKRLVFQDASPTGTQPQQYKRILEVPQKQKQFLEADDVESACEVEGVAVSSANDTCDGKQCSRRAATVAVRTGGSAPAKADSSLSGAPPPSLSFLSLPMPGESSSDESSLNEDYPTPPQRRLATSLTLSEWETRYRPTNVFQSAMRDLIVAKNNSERTGKVDAYSNCDDKGTNTRERRNEKTTEETKLWLPPLLDDNTVLMG
jgi:hypothetical protein